MSGLLTLLAGVGLSTQQAFGVVEGYVRSAGADEPLADAQVIAVGDSLRARALTGADGRYVMRDLPAGTRRLRAVRIGYTPLEVELIIPPAGRMVVDFLLPLRPVSLPAVLAEAEPDGRQGSPASIPAGATEVGPRGTGAVRVVDGTTGLSELGLIASARSLQGPRPPRSENVLYVRGAGANLNLVLLDGAPVHTPFHLGGLLEPAVTEAVARAIRLQGGASPRFDGGLSDILSLESRSAIGARPRGATFADMVSAGGLVEGGIGDRFGFVASGRALHGGATEPFLDDPFPQRYTDGLVRLDLVTEPGAEVSATGFVNRESVDLSEVRAPTEEARWGNTAASVRYNRTDGRSRAAVSAAFGEFRTDLPLGVAGTVLASGRVQRARLGADGAHAIGDLRLGYGGQIEHMSLRTRFTGEHRLTRDTVRLTARSGADTYAGYVDGEWKVSDEVRLGAGVRANLFTGGRGHLLAPRVRAEWELARGVSLDISAGRFHQMVVAPDTAVPLSLAFFKAGEGESLGTAFTEIRVAEASHVVVGLGHERPGLDLRLEGYWKDLDGVPGAVDERLRSTGLDVWVRHTSEVLSVWANYTLAWAWADPEPAAEGGILSGRHFLRGGAAARFAGRFRLEGDLAFGSGLEFGAIPGPGSTPPTAEPAAGFGTLSSAEEPAARPPDRAYLRLNLRATAVWRPRVFGVETELYPYLRVINALGRPDALFYQFDASDGRPRAVGDVPLLPVLGVEWRW